MYTIKFGDKKAINVSFEDGILLDDKQVGYHSVPLASGGYSVLLNNKSYTVFVDELDRKAKTATLLVNNHRYSVSVEEPIDLLLQKMGINLSTTKKAESLKAPMPGLVLKVLVSVGDTIQKGTPLLILEAMKMENVFKAASDAVVKAIRVDAGQAVEKGTVLIELE